MSYNQAIYQKIILDHNRSPRNFKKLEQATHTCPGNNPLCGDHLTIYLIYENEVIKDISFEGEGCAISKASASLMTEALKGRTVEEGKLLFSKLMQLLEQPKNDALNKELGDLSVFENLKSTSSRIKCVTLAWQAFIGAMDKKTEISTEKE